MVAAETEKEQRVLGDESWSGVAGKIQAVKLEEPVDELRFQIAPA